MTDLEYTGDVTGPIYGQMNIMYICPCKF